jgi:acyl-coenzyme A thioesterase PaaI-like protein
MDQERSLQETYSPNGICFGCGPANQRGLHIRSFVDGDEVVAEWRAEPHHEAFPGVLNYLMKKAGLSEAPCTVTADFHVKLLRPTPSDASISLRARVVESTDDRATVEAELVANGKVCDTCRGTFVAVKEGHPAYHRW